MLDALRGCLEGDCELRVVATATDGVELVEQYDRCRPDIVVADYSLPKLSGADATRAILKIEPSAKVVLLSAFDERELVTAALAAGAVGYLIKSITGTELVRKVKDVARGQYSLDSRTTEVVVRELREQGRESAGRNPPISEREREVLLLVSEGFSTSQIAGRLYVSPETVKTYLERAYAKLGVSNRAAAVRRAVESGIIG